MKLFGYEVDLSKLKLTAEEADAFAKHGQKTLFESILNNGLTMKYRQGIPGAKQRILGRILEKLDAAKCSTLSLEESEFDLLCEAFDPETSFFSTNQTRLVLQYFSAIEKAKTNPELKLCENGCPG